MANLEVALGKIIAPSIGPTRTESDFADHIQATVQTDPEASWIFIVDQLNTHRCRLSTMEIFSRHGSGFDAFMLADF